MVHFKLFLLNYFVIFPIFIIIMEYNNILKLVVQYSSCFCHLIAICLQIPSCKLFYILLLGMLIST